MNVGNPRPRGAVLAALSFLALAACGPPQPVRHEITGTQKERIAKAEAILSKHGTLPGPLIDAHMAEDIQDNSGGMVPGPSDSYLSGVIIVPAGDLPKWRAALSPVEDPVINIDFGGPLPPPSWWPAAGALKDCEFYAPLKLTGRRVGFVALSPSASIVWFFACNP